MTVNETTRKYMKHSRFTHTHTQKPCVYPTLLLEDIQDGEEAPELGDLTLPLTGGAPGHVIWNLYSLIGEMGVPVPVFKVQSV